MGWALLESDLPIYSIA